MLHDPIPRQRGTKHEDPTFHRQSCILPNGIETTPLPLLHERPDRLRRYYGVDKAVDDRGWAQIFRVVRLQLGFLDKGPRDACLPARRHGKHCCCVRQTEARAYRTNLQRAISCLVKKIIIFILSGVSWVEFVNLYLDAA